MYGLCLNVNCGPKRVDALMCCRYWLGDHVYKCTHSHFMHAYKWYRFMVSNERLFSYALVSTNMHVKLMSMKYVIVTTCLVVLSSRFYFGKNWLRRRTPRRTVMGTTDRRGGLVPKHLEFWNLGTEIDSLNFVTEWQDGPSWARRTVTDPLMELSLWTLWLSSRTDRRRHDGPSQAA